MVETLETLKGRQACEILEELGIDCWLIWVRETDQMVDPMLRYVYNGPFVWQTAILLARNGERFAVVGTHDAVGIPEGAFDRVVPYDEAISPVLRGELERLDPRRIAIDVSESDVSSDGMTAGMRRLLDRYLEGTRYADRFVSAERLIGKLRGRKLPEEVERVRGAIRATEEILNALVSELRVGQTEIEIHRMVHEAMAERGVSDAWAPALNPAVDAGPDKAFGHGGPTESVTRAGHLLHLDFGVVRDSYCSDLQRMVFFGGRAEVPTSVGRAFETVVSAITEAAKALRPGRVGFEIDAVARRLVVRRGYPEYAHALGHQVGRNVHDGGVLLGPRWERYGTTPDGTIEPGNVFTLELGVPVEGYGAVSLEEDVLVTEDGCEFLSDRQLELICIE